MICTSDAGLAPILSAKSTATRRAAGGRPAPLPRGTCTPPIVGACMLSNSWRRCRLDLRPGPDGHRDGRRHPPCRRRGHGHRHRDGRRSRRHRDDRPPAPRRGRPAKPPPPGRPPPPPPPGRPPPPPAAGTTATGTAAGHRPAAGAGRGRPGIIIGLGRGPPGRGHRRTAGTRAGRTGRGRGPPGRRTGRRRTRDRALAAVTAPGAGPASPRRDAGAAAGPCRWRWRRTGCCPDAGRAGPAWAPGGRGHRTGARHRRPPGPARAAGARAAGRGAGRSAAAAGARPRPARPAAAADGLRGLRLRRADRRLRLGHGDRRTRRGPRPPAWDPVGRGRRGRHRRAVARLAAPHRPGGRRRLRLLAATAARRPCSDGRLDRPRKPLELADHRRLDRRGRRTHELAHLLELGHDDLALYAELLGELVDPDLRHCTPLLGPGGLLCRRTVVYRRRTHRRVLIRRSSQSDPPINSASYMTFGNHSPGPNRRQLLKVSPHGRRVKRPRDAKRARERPATLGELQTAQGRDAAMHPARQPSRRSGTTPALDHHQAEQLGLNRANPAAHTCSQRGRLATIFQLTVSTHLRNRRRPRLLRASVSASDLMSMRHPVSRAASRAFCPSLPIASDSW